MAAYSSIGLTKALYRLSMVLGWVWGENFRYRMPTCFLALLLINCICVFQDKSEVSVTPKY